MTLRSEILYPSYLIPRKAPMLRNIVEPRPVNWHVYIILCSDDTLYTGITTDTERRFRQHAEGRGAKYFRGRQPVRLVFREGGHTRSSATRREADIKSLPREAKLLLAALGSDQEAVHSCP